MKHTLAVLVENKSGVLSRVASLFSSADIISTALPWELPKTLTYRE